MTSLKEEQRIVRLLADAEVALLTDGTLGKFGEELSGSLEPFSQDHLFVRRFSELSRLRDHWDQDHLEQYRDRWGFGGVEVLRNSRGMTFYQIRIRSFPNHDTLCYFYREPEPTLIDGGSHLPSTMEDWNARIRVLNQVFGIGDFPRCLRHLVVTHGHVDHYGFLPKALKQYRPLIYLHSLDARVLENFDERIVMAKEDMKNFFLRSGLNPQLVQKMLHFYLAERDHFPSIPVDVRIRDRFVLPGGGEVIHTPGHCPGLVCIRYDDLLLSTDLVLGHVTPHISPQALHPFFGLDNFLTSLYRVSSLNGIRISLPSHGPIIYDLNQRIQEILALHQQRLEKLLDLCEKPRTITELSQELFGERQGYEIILAIEECAAHLEYLHHHGWVRVANLEELLHSDNASPRYVVNQELKMRKKAPSLLPLNA